MKKILSKIFWYSISSKEKVEKYQQIIRDEEWEQIKDYIPKNSKFIDVGCGAGYSLMRATIDLNCEVVGIDADPGAHGVGRFVKKIVDPISIRQGFAEKLPYEDASFDVVYSSHVLEHVDSENKALKEMYRVLKENGVLIIGMPTASMASLNYLSQVVFTTHIKVYEFFRNILSPNAFKKFIKIFRISSHSYPRANSIWYDIIHYRIRNWERIVGKEFKIKHVIKPCFYPYPDFPQFFKQYKSRYFSSSVFFICKK